MGNFPSGVQISPSALIIFWRVLDRFLNHAIHSCDQCSFSFRSANLQRRMYRRLGEPPYGKPVSKHREQFVTQYPPFIRTIFRLHEVRAPYITHGKDCPQDDTIHHARLKFSDFSQGKLPTASAKKKSIQRRYQWESRSTLPVIPSSQSTLCPHGTAGRPTCQASLQTRFSPGYPACSHRPPGYKHSHILCICTDT